jgi:hypothetical protein
MRAILICLYRSKHLNFANIFEEFISYVCVVPLSFILLTTNEHSVLKFSRYLLPDQLPY